MTVVLAPGQTAANSSNIVVTSSESQVVAIYTDTDGVTVPPHVTMVVERQTAAGFFEPTSTAGVGTLLLSSASNVIHIVLPGTYRVRRPDISEFGVNVGVSADAVTS